MLDGADFILIQLRVGGQQARLVDETLRGQLERGDAAFDSVEHAVQARYDSGRVLLAPKELVLASEVDHLEPGPDGRLRYRYCKSAVIAAWSIMASPPPRPAEVPTLMVVGADSWLTLDEHADTYRAALGDDFTLVTVPGGHTVYWDALAETSEATGGPCANSFGSPS